VSKRILTPESRARLAECNRERDRRRCAERRERRAATPRAHTIGPRHGRGEVERLRAENDRIEALEPLPPRPRTRGDCANGLRPCPYVCEHSLLFEVGPNGSIKILHPDAHGDPDPDYQGPSCALDVAEAGEHTLEEIAPLLNVSNERVRQIEADAVEKVARSSLALLLTEEAC